MQRPKGWTDPVGWRWLFFEQRRDWTSKQQGVVTRQGKGAAERTCKLWMLDGLVGLFFPPERVMMAMRTSKRLAAFLLATGGVERVHLEVGCSRLAQIHTFRGRGLENVTIRFRSPLCVLWPQVRKSDTVRNFREAGN